MFTFRKKWSQVSPIPENYNATSPSLRTVAPPHFATVYNKLTGGGGGCCVSPTEHLAYLAPALCMFGLLSFVFSASPDTPRRFLGRAHVGPKREVASEQGPARWQERGDSWRVT
jgi:hypothetical protein